MVSRNQVTPGLSTLVEPTDFRSPSFPAIYRIHRSPVVFSRVPGDRSRADEECSQRGAPLNQQDRAAAGDWMRNQPPDPEEFQLQDSEEAGSTESYFLLRFRDSATVVYRVAVKDGKVIGVPWKVLLCRMKANKDDCYIIEGEVLKQPLNVRFGGPYGACTQFRSRAR